MSRSGARYPHTEPIDFGEQCGVAGEPKSGIMLGNNFDLPPIFYRTTSQGQSRMDRELHSTVYIIDSRKRAVGYLQKVCATYGDKATMV